VTMKAFLRTCTRFVYPVVAAATLTTLLPACAYGQEHVIRVLADKDSRFKIPGEKKAEIIVKAGEPLVLRIEARKGTTWSRDGAVHGFTLLRAKDHAKVPGWDFELKPGMQEFRLNAPPDPGEYEVICTVICSDDHEGMSMRFVVLP
jgi:heme/copper-type cytochrome/quinol oxidase subunit 2